MLFSFNSYSTVKNPTALHSFNLEETAQTIRVSFVTDREINCDIFFVEKSLIVDQWIKIHKFSPKGDSGNGASYTMFDEKASKDQVHYRISFKDTQGIERILGTESITITNNVWGSDVVLGDAIVSDDTEVWGTDEIFSDIETSNGEEVWGTDQILSDTGESDENEVWGTDRMVNTEASGQVVETYISKDASRINFDATCELKKFTANKLNGTIELKWLTSSEINCKHFILEKRESTETWTNLAFLNANGSENAVTQYSFIDQNPMGQTTISYRLWVTDFEGDFQILGSVSIKNVNLDETTEDENSANAKSRSLPFALINSFVVDQDKEKVNINFNTELEQNCTYFLVQKSVDQFNWQRVAKLEAVGGISETAYSEIDFRKVSKDTYFRILALDQQGIQNEIGSALLDVSSVDDIETFPNPADGQLFIQAGNDMNDIKITLSDLEGNALIVKENNYTRNLVLELSNLDKGFYILTITDGKKTRTEKILVDR